MYAGVTESSQRGVLTVMCIGFVPVAEQRNSVVWQCLPRLSSRKHVATSSCFAPNFTTESHWPVSPRMAARLNV
jgi:hypothetical protein